MTTTTTTTTGQDHYLDDLAHLIARDGIGGFESDIARVVVRLRSTGHGGTITDLLADRHQPSAARERAFGILVGRLTIVPAHHPRPAHAAA